MATITDEDSSDLLECVRQLAAEISELRAVKDRQDIHDCTLKFCRGINRRDMELLRSAFHPDAIDDHGTFVGNPDGFLVWIDKVYDGLSFTQHYIMNQTIDLDGDTAHGETYWMVVNVYKGSDAPILRGGRYIDRFEKRNGKWAIAARVCFTDWNGAPAEIQLPPEIARMKYESGTNAMDKSDLSYMRPLLITRAPRNLNPHGDGEDRKKQ